MAKSRSRNEATRDAVGGEVLAVPLPNGVFGLCIVLKRGPPLGGSSRGPTHWTVAGLTGFYDAPPPAADLRERSIRQMVRFSFRDSLGGNDLVGFVDVAPPAAWPSLGVFELTEKERARGRTYPQTLFTTWNDIADDIHAEWRWAHDREAFEKEVRDHEALTQAKMHQAHTKHAARRQALTLASILRSHHFSSWKRLWGKQVALAAEEIYLDGARQLQALGPTPDAEISRAIIRKLIDRFNELESKEGCIETEEREEVMEKVEDLARIVGLGAEVEGLTSDRDW